MNRLIYYRIRYPPATLVMARPPNADPDSTRRRILEAAVRLFGERGIDGVSIREIGRHAEVTLSTVHHHFGTKEQLHEACIDRMYQQLRALLDELAPIVAAEGDREAMIDASVRRAFRFGRANRAAIQLLLRSVVSRGELDGARRETMQRPFLELGSHLLGGDPVRVRVALTNLVYLLARNAVSTPEELLAVTGLPDLVEAERAVVDTLVTTALATL